MHMHIWLQGESVVNFKMNASITQASVVSKDTLPKDIASMCINWTFAAKLSLYKGQEGQYLISVTI